MLEPQNNQQHIDENFIKTLILQQVQDGRRYLQ